MFVYENYLQMKNWMSKKNWGDSENLKNGELIKYFSFDFSDAWLIKYLEVEKKNLDYFFIVI